MNNSLKVLFDEHQIIVNAIDIATNAGSLIGTDDRKYEDIVRQLIRFFSAYADQYHHQKEELILFPEMTKRSEFIADGIIREMFENHQDFRELIRSVETNLSQHNFAGAHAQLMKYTQELLYHIAVENEEVFQIAETLLNEQELQNIACRFQDSDRELGDEEKQRWVKLIDTLRKQLVLSE